MKALIPGSLLLMLALAGQASAQYPPCGPSSNYPPLPYPYSNVCPPCMPTPSYCMYPPGQPFQGLLPVPTGMGKSKGCCGGGGAPGCCGGGRGAPGYPPPGGFGG